MKLLKTLLATLISISIFVPVAADENVYVVQDSNSGFSETFETYYEANSFYIDNLDNYDNLVLIENDKVIDMEYGIVEFTNLVEYYSIDRNEKDYLSGVFGVDGVYLYTKQDNVYFMVSGDRGYTDINNVLLHPYETLDVSITNYSTKSDYLYHNIKTQLSYEYYSNSLCLDFKPSFMGNDSTYYSYDGHYFYNNFYTMSDDYRNETYDNAINEYPYYVYYQYLPHRSLSNYSLAEIEDYFYNNLLIDGKLIDCIDYNSDGAAEEINKSQLYDELDEFYNCQNIYGANMMMLISSALVESSYGRSLTSYLSNNLYYNAAYETEFERNNDRYNDVSNSIYSHAKYFISDLYSNYLKKNYNGTYYGNKAGGINIEYTLDHYYGEIASSEYFKLDRILGLKDYNAYAIAIFNDVDKLNIYNDEELTDSLYTISNIDELAMVLLQEGDDYYKIQLDSSFNNEYLYDFTDSVGYISKDYVDSILCQENIHEYNLNKINYDFNGGTYHDYSNISVKSLSGLIDPTIKPSADGYEFVGYELVNNEDGTSVYVANYKQISSIEIDHLYETQEELVPVPDLSEAKLTVKYEDGSKSKISITSDMLSEYDAYDFDVQTVTVNYCGLEAYKDIQIDGNVYAAYDDLTTAIENLDAKYVKDNIDTVPYIYSMSEVRNLDYILRQENNRNYVIKDNTESYNLSISGLDLSLDDRRNFNLIEDTYYVIVDDIKPYSKRKLMYVAEGYGFNIETGINISFKFNYQNIDLRGPAIVQLDIPNKTTDRIYSVYHFDSDGNIIKCRTTQSENYIQFMIDEKGDYLVLSMPSNNVYQISDSVEDLSYENMGFDNNRTNLEFLLGLFLIIVCLVGILVYYRFEESKDKQWKDYKKSLQKADTVQEEKQNN